MNGSLHKTQCRGIWWACSAVCEATGWGGKGARNPLGFPFLRKGKKGKAFLSLGMTVSPQGWLSLNCWGAKALLPTPESCTALHREVGDNGRTNSTVPTSVGNSLHPEWFGCQCLYPVSVIRWYDNIFCTFECLSCTLLTTVSLGALSNIANLVWSQSAAIFCWIHLLYWISVPGGTFGPIVEIRLLSHKSEGLGKLAYFTSEKGDWSNC